ncbi:MAG: ABC transporter permease subunit [Clostridiales bacterium]|nr:ABC transporter permease subunit [Clostridiales bacterium]
MKKFLAKFGGVIYPFAAICLLIAVWEIFAAAVNIELIIPDVKTTFSHLFALLGQKTFYKAVGNTLLRSLISFALAAIFAMALSLLSLLDAIKKLLSPVIKVMRSIPTMSIILLTVIWLKPSTSPILITFLIIFPIMYSGFFSAITGVDKELIEMSRTYKVPIKNRIFQLYLPQIMPSALDNMQSSISFTVKVIISAEVIAQTRNSMGIMMQLARGYLETAELLAWTLAAIALSYLLELVVYGIKKLVVRWK